MKFTNRNIRSWIKPLRRKHIPEKFAKFRTIIIDDIEGVTVRLNTRWLISVMDTFVDYSTVPGEREAAMMIVMLVNYDKLFRTYLRTHDQVRDEIPKKRIQLGDGVTSFCYGAKADMFKNMMWRTKRSLSGHPELSLVFKTIILRMANNEQSMICRLDRTCLSKPATVVRRAWK